MQFFANRRLLPCRCRLYGSECLPGFDVCCQHVRCARCGCGLLPVSGRLLRLVCNLLNDLCQVGMHLDANGFGCVTVHCPDPVGQVNRQAGQRH